MGSVRGEEEDPLVVPDASAATALSLLMLSVPLPNLHDR